MSSKSENNIGCGLAILFVVISLVAYAFREKDYIFMGFAIGCAILIPFFIVVFQIFSTLKLSKNRFGWENPEKTILYKQWPVEKKKKFIKDNIFHFFEIKRVGNVEEFKLRTDIVDNIRVNFYNDTFSCPDAHTWHNYKVWLGLPLKAIRTYTSIHDEFPVIKFKATGTGSWNLADIPYKIPLGLIASVKYAKKIDKSLPLNPLIYEMAYSVTLFDSISRNRKKRLRKEVLLELIEKKLISTDFLDLNDRILLGYTS